MPLYDCCWVELQCAKFKSGAKTHSEGVIKTTQVRSCCGRAAVVLGLTEIGSLFWRLNLKAANCTLAGACLVHRRSVGRVELLRRFLTGSIGQTCRYFAAKIVFVCVWLVASG